MCELAGTRSRSLSGERRPCDFAILRTRPKRVCDAFSGLGEKSVVEVVESFAEGFDGVMLTREESGGEDARGGGDVFYRHAVEDGQAEHLALLGGQFRQCDIQFLPNEFAEQQGVRRILWAAEQGLSYILANEVISV